MTNQNSSILMASVQEAGLLNLTKPRTKTKTDINSGENDHLSPLLQLLRNRN